MQRKRETRPAVGSYERVGLMTAIQDTTFQRVVLRGLYGLCAVLAAALVALSWGLTA